MTTRAGDLALQPEPIILLLLLFTGIMFVGLCFMIHLLVTWNPYHRPLLPLATSLVLISGPALVLFLEPPPQGVEPSHVALYLFELIATIGWFLFTTLLPLAFAAATLQMVRVTLHRPSEDPLMDMVEG